MIFNSFAFLSFFTLFFILYWYVLKNDLKLQNLLTLAGSYVFYAWSDWRFLSLLIAVSIFNFILGLEIEKANKIKPKPWLVYLGIIQGVGLLFYFKYFNFFITSFKSAFSFFNLNLNLNTLNILVPLGISFFTFRTISYILDIDKGKIEACKNWLVFFNYVAFFPSLLSGPIDKAKLLVPQFEKKRRFDSAHFSDGLRQILWGMFKKIVIADNCVHIVDKIFDHYETMPASSLVVGAFLYSIQLYADFSGYSDMAIGFARLLGFNITKNFDFPLFAQNIAEFWRKWHMSLTNWLTEYIFTPLSIAFRDYDKLGLIMAIIINFTICGIWHGANWTYVVFGFLHGLYFIPLILKGKMHKKQKLTKGKLLPSAKEFLNIAKTFSLVMLALIIFRSEDMTQAYGFFSRFFSMTLFQIPEIPSVANGGIIIFSFVVIMLVIEWLGKENNYALESFGFSWPNLVRWGFYYALLICIVYFGGEEKEYIYFQF